MKSLKKIFSVLFLLISFQTLFAQAIDTFPFDQTNREILFKEIETVLTQFKREDCEKTLADFRKAIKDKRITEQHYAGFLKLTNLMVKHKMKRFNFIEPLISMIVKFSDDAALSSSSFDKWIDLSLQVLNDQNVKIQKPFEDYLKWSYEFWINGNLFNTSKGGHTWKSDSKDFEIVYENKEVVIKYSSVNLFCFNKIDSLTINDASFNFFPMRTKGGLFQVSNALVNWNQDGAMDARCELKNFTINGRDISYKAEHAVLNYPSVIKVPLEGIFSDRTSKRSEIKKVKEEGSRKETEIIVTPKNLTNPKFASLSRTIKIENIGEGIDYIGGFRLEGNIVKGYGDAYGRSTIIITNRQGQVVVRATSTEFDIIKGERIISSDAEVTLYIHGENSLDSIYHPNIKLQHSILKRVLELTRGGNKTSKVPFFNSLQQSEINTNYIKWPIDSDKIDFGNNENDIDLNSDMFYDNDINEKYISISTINPLIKFAVYSEKLEQTRKERKDGACNGTNWEEPTETLDELCARDPSQCPDWKLKEIEEKKLAEQNPDSSNVDPELTDVPPPSDSIIEDPTTKSTRRLPIEEILVLLDKRMEKLNIMSCNEIAEVIKQKKPYKVIKSYKDWKDFEKNFPRKYTNGCIDAEDVLSFTHDVLGPSHDKSNGWSLIQEMIGDGFLSFDYKTSEVILRDKLFHYKNALNRNPRNKYDFDRIKINSVPSRADGNSGNAVLNIKEKSVETFGVKDFVLSDSQKVRCEPFNQQLKLKPNRDIDFDGLMTGGMLSFTGRGFHFKYDDFRVTMDTIDFIDFYVYEREMYTDEESPQNKGFYKKNRAISDSTGTYSTKRMLIRNQLRNTSGIFVIDTFNNKSGKHLSRPYYSYLHCYDTSYVFFERDNRMNKYGSRVYPKESFYYVVYPFLMDSTSKYEPKNFYLDGHLHSANIFPVTYEPLRIMFLDLSFGFETETPAEGLPIFLRDNPKGKGTFKGIYGISNQGFLGRGKMDYLGASIESEYIEFMPDRFITSNVDSFNLKEEVLNGIEFPKVFGESVNIDWLAYQDSMFIETDLKKNTPFQLFEKGEHLLTGSLNLTPNGLLGIGKFEWAEAIMNTNKGGDLVFGKNSAKSLNSEIKIKQSNDSSNNFALINKNVSGNFDFEKRKSNFISIERGTNTYLPGNSYSTSLDNYQWDMDKKIINMEASEGSKGQFQATDPKLDSLNFVASNAKLDMNNGLMDIGGVKYIQVADAYVYPKDEKINIEPNGKISRLTEARIMIDTANLNHQIQRATVDIVSKKEYKASGYLEFDIENFKKQEILFKDIQIGVENGNVVTKGKGTVEEKDNFYLDLKTRFIGDVNMSGETKDLLFTGYAKLTSSHIQNQQWFTIKSPVDKKNAIVKYDVPKSQAEEPLYVGLFVAKDSQYVYPTMMETPLNTKDYSLYTVKGLFKYDPQNNMYEFGDSSRMLPPDVSNDKSDKDSNKAVSSYGKLLTLSESSGKVTGEGPLDIEQLFNKDKMPNFVFNSFANFNFYMGRQNTYSFETTTLMNMNLPEALTNVIVNDLTKDPEAATQIGYTESKYSNLKNKLKHYFKLEKEYLKTIDKLDKDKTLDLPDNIKHTFFFSNFSLKWSDRSQSFVQSGNSGLSSIRGKSVNQVISTGTEIRIDPNGNTMIFYLVAPGSDWYYFEYKNGVLKTGSSNPNYNSTLAGMKKKDTKFKTENGNTFEIVLLADGEATNVYTNARNRIGNANR